MPATLERCVQHLIDQGHEEGSAWAICKTSLGMAHEGEPEEEYLKRAEKLAAEQKLQLKTVDIEGVEIFATGRWNGRRFTEQDLDNIVQAFKETKDLLKPYVKLGHSEDQKLLRDDELPAAGWIENLRRVGSKLLADFKRVPLKVKELMDIGAYRTRSAELYPNINLGGKTYPLALKAVALLGSATAAVGSLADIVKLYVKQFEPALAFSAGVEAEVYNFGQAKEDDSMTLEELRQQHEELERKYSESKARISTLEAELKLVKEGDVEKLKQDFSQSQAKIIELSGKIKEGDGKLAQAEAKVKESEEKLLKFARERKEEQAKVKVEELINKGKLAPAQKELAYSLILGDSKFKVGDKEYDPSTAVLEFIEQSSGVTLPTDGRTGAGEAARGVAGSGEVGVELDLEVKKFAQEHKVGYREAYLVVTRERAERSQRTEGAR